jgi:hypothetical protein
MRHTTCDTHHAPRRYATGLKLDDRHKVALSKEAVIRNKLAGNFRCALCAGWA